MPVGVARETAVGVFREHISASIVQSRCVNCHVEGGRSGHTRLVFVRSSNADHEALNLGVFEGFLAEVKGAAELILNKIQGVSHGGGEQVPAGSDDFVNMARFLELLSPSAAARVFHEDISASIVQSRCVNCHVEGGRSGHTRLVFVRSSNADHEAFNLGVFERFLAEVKGAAELILNKIQGVSHGGGEQVPAGSDDFVNMVHFLELLGEGVPSVPVTVQTLFDTVRMAPARKTLRRAALIFAGRTPTDEEYASIHGGTAALRATLRGLMTGPEFREFLLRASNDRLLTDRNDGEVIDRLSGRFPDFSNEYYRRRVAALPSDDDSDARDLSEWNYAVQLGARRAPLELIAHVVENDLPYTEILTADYIMANPFAAAAYGAPTQFDNPDDVYEFKPSRFVTYYRQGDGFELSEFDPIIDANRVLDPGPLITDYPHAGILNTTAFLRRYPTTATNRNRARSRWTYYHFLGLDIEKSASRTTDPEALADTNNPTMNNPACTVCHGVLDPGAGAFQNYGDEGYYKDQWGGVDSLDYFYKEDEGPALAIQAASWNDRETLTWSVSLAAGVKTLRVVFTNDGSDFGTIYLDRLSVTDAHGRVLASHEFEDLEPPVNPWGPCAAPEYNPVTGRNDHLQMWGGYLDCAFYIDVEVPSAGGYNVEIVAWADPYPQRAEDRFAEISVAVPADMYQEGDTWYRDMRAPGFDGERSPNSDNSVQWLAERIIADERFAEAAVKFWWPAIMGSEIAVPPEDAGDAGFEGLLLAANAQGAEVRWLAEGFRRGFHGRSRYNLKDLLVEIVLSEWFRADADDDGDPVRRIALGDAGAKRLLTPEELARKTAAVTGVQWRRRDYQSYHSDNRWLSALTGEYRLLYGGIDSDGITERARDITTVMAGVAKRHAVEVSCPVVMRELYLLPEAGRRLFAGIDTHVTPGLELAATFEVEAGSRTGRETLSLRGALTAGPKTVRLTFTNDYFEPPDADRNIYLDRLDVRNAAGRLVDSLELEEFGPSGGCNDAGGDHFGLYCAGSVAVPIDVPAAGIHDIEIVAWADQAGDERPNLGVAVESETESSGDVAIRNKLVELHDKLLGVQVTPYSPDVEAAYRLFVDVLEHRREWGNRWSIDWDCHWSTDLFYFDGILDDAVVEYEHESGRVYYDFDRDRVNEFMGGIDFADPYYTARTWVVVLSYLMMDYRYLYL